jgi:hypothetical protein
MSKGKSRSVVIAGVRFRSEGGGNWYSECRRWVLQHSLQGTREAMWELFWLDDDGLPFPLIDDAISFDEILMHAKRGDFVLQGTRPDD